MIIIRLVVLFLVFIVWGHFLSIEVLPEGSFSTQLGLGILVSVFCGVAWIFGAWFIYLGKLSGGRREARVVKALIPFAPLYIVGLPLIGINIFSAELIVSSAFSLLANYRSTETYRLVWGFKKGWRERVPDNGVIPSNEYRRIYLNIIFIYVALPLLAWITLPLLFHYNG